MRLLIVDDEKALLDELKQVLEVQRYIVETAVDGEEALDKIFDNPFDLIILDIMLPKKDGFSVVADMRNAGINVPVIMLTAKGDIEDKVKALDFGADDYLPKPFSSGELLARIRAVLRRTHGQVTPILKAGDVSLNTVTREVKIKDMPLDLTPKEFSILEFLLYNKNRVVSRFSLAEHVWGDAFDPFSMSNFVDVHVKNLRKKLRDQKGKFISTVRGVGYTIKDQEQ